MACKFPYLVQNPLPAGFSTIPVPCGKCYDCKMRIATQWAFRIYQEEKKSTSSHFVTLTYDPEHVPISKKGFMTLDDGKHLEKYWKILRNCYRYRAINPKTGRKKWCYDKVPKIKYFAVSEYGTIGDRPHYHAIILNSHPHFIEKSWKYGFVHIGNVQQASIMYCLKYMMKDGKIPKHKNDDRIPEYRRSSINLGVSYLSESVKKYHKLNPEKPYITMEGGFKVAIPRYFRKKIWNELELKEINNMIAHQMQDLKQNQEQKFNKLNPGKNYVESQRKSADYKHRIAVERSKKTRS